MWRPQVESRNVGGSNQPRSSLASPRNSYGTCVLGGGPTTANGSKEQALHTAPSAIRSWLGDKPSTPVEYGFRSGRYV